MLKLTSGHHLKALGRRALDAVMPPRCLKCGVVVADPGAVCVYDDKSRPLVTRFKCADRTDFTPSLARWMVRAGASLLDEADLIIPLPLHRWRLMTAPIL